MLRQLITCSLLLGGSVAAVAQGPVGDDLRAAVDRYMQPYVETGNFSGSILIARGGELLLSTAYGYANLEHGVPNTPKSVYHLASTSRIFTCAAVLVLHERGRVGLSDTLSKHLPGFPEGDRITIHHLLTGSSGIPHINDLEGYEVWSQSPQTAESLVEKFRELPLEYEPGERSVHSNSNYVVLALLIEKLSGKSFGDFLRDDLFEPLGMKQTGHHGDRALLIPHRAAGYAPEGLAALVNAPTIDWSVKTGNASIYSTTEDLYRWDRAMSQGSLLSEATVDRIFTNHIDRRGYGWFVGERLGAKEVHINGRSPGYGSYWGRSVDNEVTVIVLGNVYNSMPTPIGRDLIAMVIGEEYEPPSFSAAAPGAEKLRDMVGSYQFGPDYYVPNRQVTLREEEGHLFIDWAWLMPAGEGAFVDRLYGGDVEFRRDGEGRVVELLYDGFAGKKLATTASD
jgi:CubicO group peptidase (beta-lactamase class C family)